LTLIEGLAVVAVLAQFAPTNKPDAVRGIMFADGDFEED
jgi:hypothetical protein